MPIPVPPPSPEELEEHRVLMNSIPSNVSQFFNNVLKLPEAARTYLRFQFFDYNYWSPFAQIVLGNPPQIVNDDPDPTVPELKNRSEPLLVQVF